MTLYDHTRVTLGPGDSLRRAIEVIDASGYQIALVVDDKNHLLGTVTDGDIRRGILRGLALDQPVAEVMNSHPVTVGKGCPRDEVLALMASNDVKQVPVVTDDGVLVGLTLLDKLLRQPTKKENPVVILAGGQGIRLRPLTADTPKPLLKVGGQPVLELALQQLRSFGFHNIYISVRYLGQQIREYFGDGRKLGMTVRYLEDPEPLGTAGPLGLVPRPSNNTTQPPLVVLNGDLLTKVNFDELLEFHREGRFRLTVGVKDYPLHLPFGVVATEGDRVVQFREKPVETRLINAGVYVIDQDVLGMVPAGEYYDMTQLIDELLSRAEDQVGAFLIREYWMDIGTTADYHQAQEDYFVHFGPEAQG